MQAFKSELTRGLSKLELALNEVLVIQLHYNFSSFSDTSVAFGFIAINQLRSELK